MYVCFDLKYFFKKLILLLCLSLLLSSKLLMYYEYLILYFEIFLSRFYKFKYSCMHKIEQIGLPS